MSRRPNRSLARFSERLAAFKTSRKILFLADAHEPEQKLGLGSRVEVQSESGAMLRGYVNGNRLRF